jgi:raffinose/stachyose/melibiose transport system substrate-binding protein
MKNFRRAAVLCALLCLSVSVWAAEITLTMINHLDITSPEAKVFDKIVTAFEAKYPNIKLKVENLYNEAYHQKLAALAASGDLPDIIYMWPGGRSENLMKNGLAMDLYSFLGKDKSNYVPSTVAPQYEGKLLELPIAITSTHVFYINKAVLKANGLSVPKTYGDLVKMVAKLKKAGVETVLMANKDAWVNQSCLFSMVVGRFCGDKWLRDAIAGKASFTDKPFVDSIKFIKKMYEDGVLSANSIQTAYGEVPNLFAAGKGAFLIDGDWRVNAINPLVPADKQGDIVLSVFPAIPGEKFPNSTSIVTGSGYGMNAKLTGEKAKAAYAWISFIGGPEGAKTQLVDQGVMPAYKLNISGIKLDPIVSQRVAFYPKYKSSLVLDNVISSKPVDVLNAGLQAIALGTTTPEALAEQFEKAVRDNK